MSNILNVAIVGVGEIALTTHLPTLLLCSDLYRTVALCDISQLALKHASDKFHVPAVYTDVSEMLSKSPEIDLVMVMNANEYHVEHAVQSLEAGKHVFIEKPVALSLDSLDRLRAAHAASGKIAFVGYMRRYGTAFLRVKELLGGIPRENVKYVKVRDFISLASQIVPDRAPPEIAADVAGSRFFITKRNLSQTLYRVDFPPEANAERLAILDKETASALGQRSTNPGDQWTWRFLNMLATHDVSAMRDLLGTPKGVKGATRSPDGKWMTVTFDYGTYFAMFETGVDKVGKFDASIEIYADDKRIELNFTDPWIKGLPTTAKVSGHKDNGDFYEEIIRPTFEDAYTQELIALHANITQGTPVRTTLDDARQDLELFAQIIEVL